MCAARGVLMYEIKGWKYAVSVMLEDAALLLAISIVIYAAMSMV